MDKKLKEKIALYVQNVGVEKASLKASLVFVTHPEHIIDECMSGVSQILKEQSTYPASKRIAELYYYSAVMDYLYGDEEEVYSELKKIIDDNSRNA